MYHAFLRLDRRGGKARARMVQAKRRKDGAMVKGRQDLPAVPGRSCLGGRRPGSGPAIHCIVFVDYYRGKWRGPRLAEGSQPPRVRHGGPMSYAAEAIASTAPPPPKPAAGKSAPPVANAGEASFDDHLASETQAPAPAPTSAAREGTGGDQAAPTEAAAPIDDASTESDAAEAPEL